MKFKNFTIWRGRLPHWRAEEVTYYVTFRHRRALDASERLELLDALRKADGKRWDVLLLCVLPEGTEMLVQVREDANGRPFELAGIVEHAKSKAGRQIIKGTGERYPPFYSESYDRIVRDEQEQAERWQAIIESPVIGGHADSLDDYETLYWRR